MRTAAEIEQIERRLGEPRFVGSQLKIEFLTDHETVRRLLPPPLEAGPEPRAAISIGAWHSNNCGDFTGATVYLQAQFGGVLGGYGLAMWMDSEPATMFGRDLFGEPKKLAAVNIAREDDRISGSVERNGTRIISVGALTDEEGEAAESTRVAYHFRARTAADGVGLAGPAVLTRATFRDRVLRCRRGSGALELRGTVHDPLDELEVVTLLGASYTEQDMAGRCEPVATVPAERFLPYHHGRADDWLALDTLVGAGVHVE